LIQESETTHLLAELGVVFLLFDIGLHFTLSNIWEARRDIFGLGPLQILLCGFVFGGIAVTFGLAVESALILGGALALSSTAVVVQTMAERGQRNCPVGVTGTAVLIFQDICAIFLLILAASLGQSESPGVGTSVAGAVSIALVKAAIAFGAALLIGRYAIEPLFRLFSQTRNEEIFTALALLVVLATAAATGGMGLSLTLGAFLGGMIIAETPYRHLIQTEAKPFRNLLLGFFFITVGMSLDWRALVSLWTEIVLFLAVFIVVKTALIALAAKAVGWSTPGSLQLGSLLAQGSEFVFVIIAMPSVRDALGEDLVGVVFIAMAASLALTPTLASLGNRLAKRLRQRSASAQGGAEVLPKATAAPVVIFGMDDVGRLVAEALEAQGVPYDGVEGDYDRFLAASADGYPVAFGNLGDVRLMEALGYAERRAIVIPSIRYELAESLAPTMRERYPGLPCFTAVKTEEEKSGFEILGLRPILDRSAPRGLDLAAAVLRHQDVPEEKIGAWVKLRQERALELIFDGQSASDAYRLGTSRT
jgi:CPA2 family monovalent cation:H+ antiporter-2